MSTTIYENIPDDEQIINYEQVEEPMNLCSFDKFNDRLEIRAPNGILTSCDNNIFSKPLQNVLQGVHERDEPYEMISDDDLDDISLPEMMKVHLSPKPHYLNEQEAHHKGLFD